MGKSSKSKEISPTGSRLYSLSYAFSAMKANPFRALSLALTLGLGISLLVSNIVWTDTGVQVTVDEFLESSSFQMLVKTYEGGSEQGALAFEYLLNDPLVEEVMRIESTLGFLWGTDYPDDHHYVIDETQYSMGVKDTRVIFVNNEFLDRVSIDFTYEGEFHLGNGEALVSTQFLAYAEEVFNVTLGIGDDIDLEVLGRSIPEELRANIDNTEIGNLDRYSITNFTIAGIYNPRSSTSLVNRAFPSYMRPNWNYTNVRYPVLGLRDSVMVLNNSVPAGWLFPDGWFPAHSLVRVNGDVLIAEGEENIANNLETLATRIDEQFYIELAAFDHVYNLQFSVNSYLNSVNYSMLNLPIFFLALVLSVFAADTFMAPRTTEVGVLRSKGASTSQIYGVFLWESLLLAVLSLFLGVFLATLFAALIPATTSFMTFDWTIYEYYWLNSVVKLDTLVTAVMLCIVPPLLFIAYAARRAAQAEIGVTMEQTAENVTAEEASYGFTITFSILLLTIVVVAAIFFPRDPVILFLDLGLATAAWFFMAYNGSRVSRVGLAGVSSRLSFVLGQKNRIAAGYLRMRRGRIIPLMLVLALTMSSTIAFSVQAESLRTDLEREVYYAVGADLRVETESLPLTYCDTLESYDEISLATPVYRAWGRVGSDDIAVTALNASKYASIGHFDESSFPDQDPATVLATLESVSNGIIISAHYAQRWNKAIGDQVRITVSAFLVTEEIMFNVTGIVYSAPGFGYAWRGDIPTSRLGAGFGFQSYKVLDEPTQGFVFTNLDFITSILGKSETDLFMASLSSGVDEASLIESLTSGTDVEAITPATFDLKTNSYGTALFLNTIEGLFSIGFVMALVMSLFALSIFLGSVVRERRKEYAILRALGGSRRQVVSMVFSEFTGVVLASLAVSLVLGTIFAYVNGFLLFQMSPFSRTLEATITVPLNFLLIVLAIEIVAMVVGAYMPAREAGRTDPAIVLRNL